MLRKDLLDKLVTVSPALASTDLIPILTHFWFDGGSLVAYNDQIGISVPFETDIEGAVPGATLLNLLKTTSRGITKVVFSMKEAVLEVAAGRARMKLALMPPKDFEGIFEMPEAGEDRICLESDKEFLDAIETCLRSVGNNTGQPDQLGITLISKPKEKVLHLYATNSTTLSFSKVKVNGKVNFTRIILPTAFCTQLLKLGRIMPEKEAFHLEVLEDDGVLFAARDVWLFGRLVESAQPLNFEGILDHHYPAELEQKMIDVTDLQLRLQRALERAVIITDSTTDQGTTVLYVEKDEPTVLRFLSETDRGVVKDSIVLTKPTGNKKDKPQKHPVVSVRLEPKQLKAGLGFFDRMLVTKSCVIMENAVSTYLVSAHRG